LEEDEQLAQWVGAGTISLLATKETLARRRKELRLWIIQKKQFTGYRLSHHETKDFAASFPQTGECN
jgi:hypothetical protein